MRPGRVDDPHISRRKRAAAPTADLVRVSQPITCSRSRTIKRDARVAVEINANSGRLDLDWCWHESALERGCMMSINPDAHSTDEIDLTHWGVVMAP
jgi:hypothetical protein